MPAPQQNFTVTEIKAGLLVLVSGVVFTLFVLAIMGYRPASNGSVYHAQFSDTGGLRLGADVRFGGLKVGRVTALTPSPDDQSLIRATVLVTEETPVNEDSRAYITQTTLTAEKHLEISTGSKQAARLESGSVLRQGTGGMFGEIEAVAGGVTQLLEDVGVLLGVHDAEGNVTMTDEEQQTIAELFAELGGIAADLKLLMGVEDSEGNLVMSEVERKTVADLFVGLDDALQGGTALVEDVRGTLDENRESIKEAVDGIVSIEEAALEVVEGVGVIVEDSREQIDGALSNVNDITEEVEQLVIQLRGLTTSIDDLMLTNEPVIEDILLDVREAMRNLESFSRTLADEPQAIIRGKSKSGR